jgi:endonuclease/exonuclease/phosphatase (EEP) superfamily protein YafD
MTDPAERSRRPVRPNPALRRVLVAASSGMLIGTVAGFLGALWWAFDLVANLRTQLAAGLLVVAAALAIIRLPRAALVTLVGAALNLAVVLPFLSGAASPAPTSHPDAETLDVTFFNTKIRSDVAAVVDYLEDRDDDVIVLAATTTTWVDALDAADLDLYVVSGTHRSPGLELLVLTRDPDTPVAVHRLTDEDRDTLVEVVIELDGHPVHLIGTHPVSPQTPRRAQRRDLVLAWLGQWSSQREGARVAVGDLNATPWSAPFGAMLEQGGLIDSQRTHGLQPSWPAGTGVLGLPLDHVLHSPDLVTLERELGPSFGSDHRMVHARIARRAAS